MQQKRKFTIQQLVIDAMLCAVCAVLGYLAIDLMSVKVTFETIPILVAALLFGYIDAAAVGAVGTLIYQLIRYGFTSTTFLWMIPYIICGLIVGLYAQKKSFKLTPRQLSVIVIIGELAATLLNTVVIYIDSKIYGWYYPTLITGSLVIRLVICIVKAIAYSALLVPLLKAIRRTAPAAARLDELKK
ncbi:MAG: folate family ECF transporter S component [Lachnospiraceae bacterium]|nr:folate family ECF transporter S component [Lachnospiraceae bacterium]